MESTNTEIQHQSADVKSYRFLFGNNIFPLLPVQSVFSHLSLGLVHRKENTAVNFLGDFLLGKKNRNNNKTTKL